MRRSERRNKQDMEGMVHSSLSGGSSSLGEVSAVSSLSGGENAEATASIPPFRLSAPQQDDGDEEQQPSQPTREWEEDADVYNLSRKSYEDFHMETPVSSRRVSNTWGDLSHAAFGGEAPPAGPLTRPGVTAPTGRPPPLIPDVEYSSELLKPEEPKQGPRSPRKSLYLPNAAATSKVMQRMKEGLSTPVNFLSEYYESSQKKRKTPQERQAGLRERQQSILQCLCLAIGLLLTVAVAVTLALMIVEGPDLRDKDTSTDGPTAAPTTAVPTAMPSASPTQAPPTHSPTLAPTSSPPLDTLDSIQRVGRLRCGIDEMPGFGEPLTDNSWTGLHADWCRAIAAAILGNPNAVQFTRVLAPDRFATLQNGQIDVLIAGTTANMERNVMEASTGAAFDFSIPYLYDGVRFAGDPMAVQCAQDQDTTSNRPNRNCTNLAICTVQGTTHQTIVANWIPQARAVLLNSFVDIYVAFAQGLCNVISGEQFQLSGRIVEQGGYVGDYLIGDHVYSKEPLALATRSDDKLWSDVVNWVVVALLHAELEGIDQSTANVMGETQVFGTRYDRAFIDAVIAVGNYGQMYERHVEEYVSRDDANHIHSGTEDTGLQYSFPFGSLTANTPNPSSGILVEIISRGYLKCGIANGNFGMDVDLCKAISAAIFDGIFSTMEYVTLSATQALEALQNGDVDIVARPTVHRLEPDVFDASTSAGYTFSPPIFYDALTFGGIPEYVECATEGDPCPDLRICVVEGTYFQQQVEETFDNVAVESWSEAVEELGRGNCNVLVGGTVDTSPRNMEELGYTGPYRASNAILPYLPMAMVTRQEDQVWSNYVRWIINALIYAEEEGITQATFNRMPTVDLFGRVNMGIFRDAVEAVGSYGDLYERNLEPYVPRRGINLLNGNPLGPQLYPLPGL